MSLLSCYPKESKLFWEPWKVLTLKDKKKMAKYTAMKKYCRFIVASGTLVK